VEARSTQHAAMKVNIRLGVEEINLVLHSVARLSVERPSLTHLWAQISKKSIAMVWPFGFSILSLGDGLLSA
jgi:hypothetical protein